MCTSDPRCVHEQMHAVPVRPRKPKHLRRRRQFAELRVHKRFFVIQAIADRACADSVCFTFLSSSATNMGMVQAQISQLSDAHHAPLRVICADSMSPKDACTHVEFHNAAARSDLEGVCADT